MGKWAYIIYVVPHFIIFFQQTLLSQGGINRSNNVHVCPSRNVIGWELSIPILICMNYDHNQWTSTWALSEMRPNWGGRAHMWLCCMKYLFWSFVPHLSIFCNVLYLLFIITHPGFCTHSLDCRANLTMSGSQDNLSKPIKITIADGKQII